MVLEICWQSLSKLPKIEKKTWDENQTELMTDGTYS